MSTPPRAALVTGASRGIGRAIALALASAGYSVAITARDAGALALVADELTSLGSRAVVIPCDIADPGAPQHLHRAATAELGPLDVLVNNAAIGASANLATTVDFDDDAWSRTMHVNVTVPYQLSKAVVPVMIERRWGRIINIASIHSRVPLPRGVAYTASKHALLGLTRTLALEIAGTGVTVNAVCPGPVLTRMAEKRLAFDSERLGISVAELAAGITPLGRLLTPDEISPTVVYLASDAASAITGQGFDVDGGLVMA